MSEKLVNRDVDQVLMHVKAAVLTAQSTPTSSNLVLVDMDSDQFGVSHLRRRAKISPDGDLGSARPYVGKLIRHSKRVVRRLMRWYIKPPWEQQSGINLELIDAVNRLHVENAELRADVTLLKNDLHGTDPFAHD